ncbi:MAG: hypothetical protein HNEKOMLI_00470 [Sodalis sp. Psp]|nr:hypothetical protein [Sodalis sp. Psp]MCR3756943.1 hypothetical protein [Sodalis sp. Ppy]
MPALKLLNMLAELYQSLKGHRPGVHKDIKEDEKTTKMTPESEPGLVCKLVE